MLSIGKLSAGQVSYYERQVARGRDDYYSGRGEAPGEWGGRGAAAPGPVRRGKAGAVVEPGEGVVAAAYRHRMSRALDPQLHTHVVSANVARGPDGRWTALDARHLYDHAKTAGFLYQAHLRAEVRDRLGLEWGPVTKGAAELRAVPAEVLAVFSRRRQEIVEAAREAGVEDLASERGTYLAVLTRERKQYGVETHTWREEIRARAGEHGLDRDAIEQI